MNNMIKFDAPYVATEHGVLEEGQTYQYMEGSFVADVVLLAIIDDVYEWRFQLYFIGEKRKTCVSFTKRSANLSYYGMWRITDAGRFDISKVNAYREKLDEQFKDIEIPVMIIPDNVSLDDVNSEYKAIVKAGNFLSRKN